MSAFTPQQLAFIEKVGTTRESIRLDAVAGSGKTTTLKAASQRISPSRTTTLVAFNKNTADEAAKKFPAHIQCKTMNAIGHGIWLRATGKKTLDTKKMATLTTEWVKEALDKDTADMLWMPIKTVVTAIKAGGYVPPQWAGRTEFDAQVFDADTVEAILISNDFANIDVDLVHRAAQTIMLNSIAQAYRDKIDFDDQIYMATYYAAEEYWPQNDTVLVDEAQDLSTMQHDFIDRLGARSRLIIAGDPNQAIYGWRGASTSSLDQLEARFNLTRMPLTVSFRCPDSIVAEAKQIVPHIQAANSGGQVFHWNSSDNPWFVEDFEKGSVVLCRNNAPLIKLGFAMVRAGIPCYFAKGDIVQGMTKTVQSLPESTVLLQTINDWYFKEKERLERKQAYGLIDRLEDKYEALLAVLSGCGAQTKSDLIKGINSLFMREYSPAAIELSTIHRAKGKEWKTVYFLNQHIIPGRWLLGMQEEEVPGIEELIAQEYNLKYVAITRSLDKLVYFTLAKDEKVKSRKDTQ